ncbi:rhodanese-like protein [Hyaloraphidium curvatum]|nr:rhodanese-like protein [Hyaloraphidium curvatum]
MTKTVTYASVRSSLLERREIALLDVREEAIHARGHPLFAACFPLSRLELNAFAMLPRRDVPVVVMDGGEGDAEIAAARLAALGYTDVAVLEGGLDGWKAAGGEMFIDVNVPSKAFGELVESVRHTPSLSAREVHALVTGDGPNKPVVVDARRFDEFQRMSIPTGTSVPGAELVLRVPSMVPDEKTTVIVNCAGRTRSIVGTQSLINAGLPNPVYALRNGTIGFSLEKLELDHGQARKFPEAIPPEKKKEAADRARLVADRAGVRRTTLDAIADWKLQRGRTTYLFDVRTPEEYEAGHLPGFRTVPGGQLVQETEMVAPVRGARIVLADDDGVRANMTASWLAQMNWEVYVLDRLSSAEFTERGPWPLPLPPSPEVVFISPEDLAALLPTGKAALLDMTTSGNYLGNGRIPGAWFFQRSRPLDALATVPEPDEYVLTCATSILCHYAFDEFRRVAGKKVRVVRGGTEAWKAAGLPIEKGSEGRFATGEPRDRYRRPYEGTGNAEEAMRGYIEWELGLVEQLGRDGTHGFFVV